MSDDDQREADELARLVRWRRREALEAGLTPVEAKIWAETPELDVGELRHLVELGCPKDLLARVVL